MFSLIAKNMSNLSLTLLWQSQIKCPAVKIFSDYALLFCLRLFLLSLQCFVLVSA